MARVLIIGILVGIVVTSAFSQRGRQSLADVMDRDRAEQLYEVQLQQILQSRPATAAAVDPEQALPLDKNTTKLVRQFRKIREAEAGKYREFLTTPHSGILRFFPDNDCVKPKVIDAGEKCRGFVPQSYSYSFRRGEYSDLRFNDIAFKGDTVTCGSFFAQGILLPLGDVAVESVTAASEGVSDLISMPVDTTIDGARTTASRLRRTFTQGSTRFGTTAKAVVGATYALRVIAYKLGNTIPAPSQDMSLLEKRFSDLYYDQRADLTVVFRIVDRSPDGAITVVWKQLDKRSAPKLKFEKGDSWNDFRVGK